MRDALTDAIRLEATASAAHQPERAVGSTRDNRIFSTDSRQTNSATWHAGRQEWPIFISIVEPGMATKLKLALVGCGHIAEMHLHGIQTGAGQIEVTAVVDTDPAKAASMARRTGAQPFCRLEDALRSGDFSAVDIMLPHSLHEEAALLAFAAGKHVILEKPMATSVEECARILSSARAAGTVFMVAEQSQYWSDALAVRQQISDGAIGDLIAGRAFLWRPRKERSTRSSWRNSIAATGGGVCIDGGAHWIRPLRMWFGEVQEVVADLGNPLPEMEGESLAHGLLRFRSGAVVVLGMLVDGACAAPVEEFRVTGTEGELSIERPAGGGGGRVVKHVRGHDSGEVLMTDVERGRRDSFGHELNDFASAVLRGSPLQAEPEDSLGELRTALAMYRSAESRQWESVW